VVGWKSTSQLAGRARVSRSTTRRIIVHCLDFSPANSRWPGIRRQLDYRPSPAACTAHAAYWSASIAGSATPALHQRKKFFITSSPARDSSEEVLHHPFSYPRLVGRNSSSPLLPPATSRKKFFITSSPALSRIPLQFIQQALFRAPQTLSRGITYSVA
jgi:hypothetical protein